MIGDKGNLAGVGLWRAEQDRRGLSNGPNDKRGGRWGCEGEMRLERGLRASGGTHSLSWGQLGALGRVGLAKVYSLGSHPSSGLEQMAKDSWVLAGR